MTRDKIIRIKIIKANRPTYWYAKQIGNHYFVKRGIKFIDDPQSEECFVNAYDETRFFDIDDVEIVEA
jgi:hypothetical protein